MHTKTRALVLAALFAALTAAGAWIRIPIGPAPITLQFFFTALAGALLGPKIGALSQLIYVLLGLLGVPVFTSGGGLASVLTPTFGYLLGFIAAPIVIGLFVRAQWGRPFWRALLGCLLGVAIIYAVGVPYLYLILNYVTHTPFTLRQAFLTGCAVFLPGDILKSIAVSLLSVRLLPLLRRQLLKKA